MPLPQTDPVQISSTSLPANNQEMAWIVLKFGGTSVSTKSRWDTIVELAAKRIANQNRVLIVVSALSGVTDQLKALCEAFNDDARTADLRLSLHSRHIEMAQKLGLSGATLARVMPYSSASRRP